MTDTNLESCAAREFERLFRLSEHERRAGAASDGAIPARVQERTAELLKAYDRNVADRFLEPTPTVATEELQRLLGEGTGLACPLSEDLAPQSVGTFRILRPISQGELCTIFLAEQTGPVVRPAAVKLLHSTARRRETLRRFDTERQAIAAMRHPNIAQFFEAGASESGHAYFAMEYIDGPQITSFCVDHHLAVRDRLRLFLQLCGAIVHAHQRGILHRDLKPSNILVAPHGDSGLPQVKVIDFGVSKAMERSEDSRATMTGQVVGTPAYMSPEQLRGDPGAVDTRSDVYSLALVLFEMLTGRAAFPEDRPARLGAARSEFRGDLDTIFAKAAASDPDRRYESVADFANDIERFLDGRPVIARNPGVAYIATKFMRRHLLATCAGILALIAGVFAGRAVIQARAERSDLAMQVADAWLEQVLESQRTIGESAVRESKAGRLVQQVRQFASQLPGDPRAQSMLASAVTELGYVHLEKGRYEAADRDFGEALGIRRDLAAVGFGRLDGMGDLSLAMIRCGDAAGAGGDRERQRALYHEALEIDKRAVAAHPNDRMALSNLGWSWERLAVLLDSDDRARLDWFARQLEVFSRLNAAGPTADSERGLCSAYANLALSKLHMRMPFAPEAQQALVHGRAACTLAPNDRHIVHASLKAEFIVALSQTDPTEGASQFTTAIGHAVAFCDQDTHDAVGRDLLPMALMYSKLLFAGGILDEGTRSRLDEAKRLVESRLVTFAVPDSP